MGKWAGSALSFLLTGAIGATVAMTFRAPQGSARPPHIRDNGATLTVSGHLAGLAPSSVRVRVEAEGVASAVCRENGASHEEAREGIPVYVCREKIYGASELMQGTLDYALTTEVPDAPALPEAACPDETHHPEVTDVTFQYLTLTLEQDRRPLLRQVFNTQDLIGDRPAPEGM